MITPAFQQPPDKHGFSAHTPDPTKYHPASPETGQRLSSGTVIPRASVGRFGPSRGFDTSPGVVFVDPIDPYTTEGGMRVDLRHVEKTAALAAVETAQHQTLDPTEQRLRALEILSMPTLPAQLPANGSRVNHVFPNAYIVPPASLGGGQINYPSEASVVAPDYSRSAQITQPYTQPQYQQPQLPPQNVQQPTEQNPWMVVAQLQSQLAEVMNVVRAQQDQMRSMTAMPVAPPKPVTAALHNPSLEDPPPQMLGSSSSSQTETPPAESRKQELIPKERAVQLVKETFDSFQIPDLGPAPLKPRHEVVFDLGIAGKHNCKFHWVGEHERGVFLIYDTRYEDGVQYSPPYMEQPIKISLPKLGKSYLVHSFDFTHPFGVFNIVNLIKVEAPQQQVQESVESTLEMFDASPQAISSFFNQND